MKNLRNKINVIFTGKFLKYWYLAFVLIVGLMVTDLLRNKSVDSFDLILFDSSGNVIENRVVSKKDLPYINEQLPVTKSYKPIK